MYWTSHNDTMLVKIVNFEQINDLYEIMVLNYSKTRVKAGYCFCLYVVMLLYIGNCVFILQC